MVIVMKLKRILILASLLLTTSVALADGPDPNFYIFLCFGQSNMEGFPGVEQQDKAVDKRFQLLAAVDFPNLDRKKGNWYGAVPPLCAPFRRLLPSAVA